MKKSYYFRLLLLSTLFISVNVHAQLVFENNAIADNSAGTDNTLDFFVPTGTDRLLIVTIGTDDIANSPTVTFGSSVLSLAGEDIDNHNDTYDSRVMVYYLILGTGPSVSNTITVQGLTSNYSVGAMTFNGIDQINPKKQAGQAGTPSPADDLFAPSQVKVELTGVSAGNLLFSFFGEDNVKQFDWGGPYIAEGIHRNTALDGGGYYYATFDEDPRAGFHEFAFDINNGGQTCAGVLIEFTKSSRAPLSITCTDRDVFSVTPTVHTNFLSSEQTRNGGTMPNTVTQAASDTLIGTATIAAFNAGVKPEVVFQAKNVVILDAGFHAVAGSKFTAKIADCRLLINELHSELPADSRIANLENDFGPLETELNIYPNPSRYATTIQLDLPESGLLSLQVMNQNGQVVSHLAQSNHQEKGTYYYQLSTENLPPGFYLVQMQNGKERITKKLIVQ